MVDEAFPFFDLDRLIRSSTSFTAFSCNITFVSSFFSEAIQPPAATKDRVGREVLSGA